MEWGELESYSKKSRRNLLYQAVTRIYMLNVFLLYRQRDIRSKRLTVIFAEVEDVRQFL